MSRQFEKADKLRDDLKAMGIHVDDRAKTWSAGLGGGGGGGGSGSDSATNGNEEFGGFGEQAEATPPTIDPVAFSDAIANIEALKARMDVVEAAANAKKDALPASPTPMPTSNASELELEVQGVVARLERLEASTMSTSAAFGAPTTSAEGKKEKMKGKKPSKSNAVGLDL